MVEDLQQCNNDFERSMVKAIGGRAIREKAEQWARERKLTPVEVTIASGIRIQRKLKNQPGLTIRVFFCSSFND